LATFIDHRDPGPPKTGKPDAWRHDSRSRIPVLTEQLGKLYPAIVIPGRRSTVAPPKRCSTMPVRQKDILGALGDPSQGLASRYLFFLP